MPKVNPAQHREMSRKKRELFYAQKRAIKKGIVSIIPDSLNDIRAITGKMFNLIHKEVKAKIDVLRDAESRLERVGKKQGFVFDLGKYHTTGYEMGTIGKDNSAEDNNPFVSLLTGGMNRAESERAATANSVYQSGQPAN